MLASALRFFLLLEICLYAGIGHVVYELAAAHALFAALLLLLFMRAGIVLMTYLFAYLYHSRAPTISGLQVGSMILAEYLACLRLFLILLPFERFWMGEERLASDRPMVLLVHGYGGNRGVWWSLRRRLEGAGYAVATLNLERLRSGSDEGVRLLAERIEELSQQMADGQLSLIGHGMGGLIARAYLAAYGETRVRLLVTIGTPHAGSVIARYVGFMLGTTVRQMVPQSPWLRSLWQYRPRIRSVSVRLMHDNVVMPQDGQRFPGAQDVTLPALGHLASLFSRRTAAVLLEALLADRDKLSR